ncbi:hypothetical protein Q7P37_008134 [Cladosporium fusiforme]
MPRRSRAQWAKIVAIITLVSLFLIWKDKPATRPQISLHKTPDSADKVVTNKLPSPRGFEPFKVQGFVNTGTVEPEENPCDSLRHTSQLYAEKHRDVEDDIQSIAESLKDHPMIDYSTQDQTLSHKEIVAKTWLRMAQSSAWLKHHGFFLTVTRVAFYTKGVRHWPLISFLRVQVHDADWNELRDYDIHWQGETIRFPRILDIPAPYVLEGAFYGPEDPRIIVEDHPDAEPVIVFNMLHDVEKLHRGMHITRPFSNDTTKLQIVGGDPEQSEKNWMPFVYNEASSAGNAAATGLDASHNKNKWPTHHLHFVYDFKPLRILKCHLLNGWCHWIYQQPEAPDSLRGHRNDRGGVFRGGTNLVATSAKNGVQTFVGFPKSHVRLGCEEAIYRPSMLVLTATSPHQFHIDYMSDSVDFGDQALTATAKSDPCGEGRIMMANSIARWERSAGEDLMTVTYTVDDMTTQTMRIHGVEAFVESMPGRSRLSPSSTSESTAHVGSDLVDVRWSKAGHDVLACSVEAVEDYALRLSEQVNGTDLRKMRVEEEERLRAEEQEAKELKTKLGEAHGID